MNPVEFKKWRIANKLSRMKVSHGSGVDPQTIYRFESRITEPQDLTVKALMEFMMKYSIEHSRTFRIGSKS